MKVWAGWAAILGLLCFALSCQSKNRELSVEARLSEFIDDPHAQPRLLQDHDELKRYLRGFPRDHYNIFKTKNGFSFFIEKEKRVDGIKQIVSKGEVWEEDFIKLMATHIRPGSTVIDIGAYIGTHTTAMAKEVGPRGHVYAFEPQKKVFRELAYNLIENRIANATPLRFALGEETRVIEMDRPVNGIEANVGVGHGGDRAELRTLDSFGFQDVSFIKVDVEGYEDGILDGARRTILKNHNPPILVEIQKAAHYVTAPPEVRSRIEGTVAKLEALGYAVTPLRHRDYLALPAAPYRLGSVLSFAESGGAGPHKSGWWSEAEPWGAWTTGYAASLVLRLSSRPQRDLVLTGRVKAFLNALNPQLEVEVLANGVEVDRWVFIQDGLQSRKAVIPASAFRAEGDPPVLRITFRLPRLQAPANLAGSPNTRLLGLGVQELVVRELPPAATSGK